MSPGPDGAARPTRDEAQLQAALQEWHPVAVDELQRRHPEQYDLLVASVLTRLSRGATVGSMAEYLWFEARDHLGIDPARPRADLLSERLIAWYRDRDAPAERLSRR
jgi:hypothetical protein